MWKAIQTIISSAFNTIYRHIIHTYLHVVLEHFRGAMSEAHVNSHVKLMGLHVKSMGLHIKPM